MNKLLYSTLTIIGMFLTVAFITISNESKAFSFSDIKDAITGHINDAKDRFKNDEIIQGTGIHQSSFTWSSDSIHYAHGEVEIIKKDNTLYVQLAKNFSAGFAPDLYIYISKGHIKSDDQFKNNNKIELGKLIKGSGASYYKIPSFLTQYHNSPFSVVIHCKRFNEPMGAAHF